MCIIEGVVGSRDGAIKSSSSVRGSNNGTPGTSPTVRISRVIASNRIVCFCFYDRVVPESPHRVPWLLPVTVSNFELIRIRRHSRRHRRCRPQNSMMATAATTRTWSRTKRKVNVIHTSSSPPLRRPRDVPLTPIDGVE